MGKAKTMRINRKGIILLSIMVLAAFLRLYRLGDIPPGVNRDEASIGYTAYSLLKTGKDEYGRPFPFSFQSFGDWKLPLYIYTTVPFVKLFGLNEFAVRLPSALAGIFTVLLTYFLIKEIFQDKKAFSFDIGHLSFDIASIATAILALSPWHTHFSRVESESNVAVLFVTLGLVIFYKALKNKPHLFPMCFIFWGLTYATYHGNHVFTTLFILGLLFLYRKQLLLSLYAQRGFLAFTLIGVVVLSQTLFGADKTKLSGISIFGDPNIIHEKIEIPRNTYSDPRSLLVRLRYNRLTFATWTIARNYIMSFSPQFLFLRGGTNHAHNIEGFGNLYIVEAPFLLLGIWYLIRHRNKSPQYKLLLWWLLISPLAASITKDAPHTNRMFAIFPLPAILSALGIIVTSKYLRHVHRALRVSVVILIVTAFLWNVSIYLGRYYVDFPNNEAQYWGYGYKQLTSLLWKKDYRTKDVIMSRPEYSPYIFLLFYSQFDPTAYQKTAARYPPTDDAFIHVKQFDRFTFRAIDWNSDIQRVHTVLVDESRMIPSVIRTGDYKKTAILLPNGKEQFLAVIQ